MSNDMVILSVYFPVDNETVEVRVFRGMRLAQVTKMLSEIVKRKEGFFIPDDNTVLCDRASGRILDLSAFIDDLGLHNGSELMMI